MRQNLYPLLAMSVSPNTLDLILMTKPPERIDGAKVLEWAWSETPFGELPYQEGGVTAVIHGLAICQYEGENQVYRFSCDAEWECQQDQIYETVEEAKTELPNQYRNVPAGWKHV